MKIEQQIRDYYTKLFERELGKLDEDDKEVLECAISFEIVSDKIRRLF